MISIIIPAYNAAQYLERVVGSITSQNRQDGECEIIIVENGSTDNTTEVAEKIEEQHQNVRVLHSDKGVSNARNLGIAQAKGEWIAFADADDYWVKDSLDFLLRDVQENKSDLYVYGYEAGNHPNVLVQNQQVEYYDENSIDGCRVMMLQNPTRYMQVWNKLFRKDLIVQHNIAFQTNLRLSEDSDFTLQYLVCCKTVQIMPEILYHYSIDNISTMRNAKSDKIKDYVLAMEVSQKHIKNCNEELHNAYQKYVLMHFNIAMVRDLYCATELSFLKKVVGMKQILYSNVVFYEAMQSVRLKECISARMAPFFCFKMRLPVLAGLIYTLRVMQNKKKEK